MSKTVFHLVFIIDIFKQQCTLTINIQILWGLLFCTIKYRFCDMSEKKDLAHKHRNIMKRIRLPAEYRKIFFQFQQLVNSSDNAISTNYPPAVAIVLNYARPNNIQWITKALLQCDFIEKVIISNNNPNISMQDWLEIDDHRVDIRNQPTR